MLFIVADFVVNANNKL